MYSMQIFRDVIGMVQTAEPSPCCFEAYASQTAVPSLVLLLAICLRAISTPFMGCRLRTHACEFPAKSLCLVLSGERPDQSDWDITHLAMCFWLFPPILAAPQAFLISPSPQGALSFFHTASDQLVGTMLWGPGERNGCG